jgi:Outer membrane protein beta-barrel family
LLKHFSIELSGVYQSKSLSGLTTKLPMGSMDAGIKKRMPGRVGTFVLTVNNVFNTLVSRNRTDIPERNLYYNFDVRFAQRSFKLSYTRDFGKEKLKQKRERSTGAEDEKKRMQ